MNGKTEGTGMQQCEKNSCNWEVYKVHRVDEPRTFKCSQCDFLRLESWEEMRRRREKNETSRVSADTRAVCDKLDFLGRFVVAAIIRASSRDHALSTAQASLADADAILTANAIFKTLQEKE